MIETTFKKIIRILSDGEFHSGADLGRSLGMTRAAIWKLIHRLKLLDVEVDAIPNKGYCIPGGLALLDLAKIKAYVNQNFHAYLNNAIIFDEIPSTNTYLLQKLHDQSNASNATNICLAESQSQGRGRFKRVWLSPFGRNVYLSMRWHFRCDLSELSGLNLVIALAICRTLAKYNIKDITLKWPNDVLWQKRKIAGSLIELIGESHDECDAVIGIGLNLHIPTNLKKNATFPMADVFDILKTIPKRNMIIGMLIEEVLSSLILFQEKGFAPFMLAWQALDPTFNKPILVRTGTRTIRGINRGINERGGFRLENEAGNIITFSNGEVSLFGI